MSDPRRSRSTRLAGGLLLSASTLLLGFVLLEIGVRTVYGDRYGPRPIFYDRHPTLGWAPSPGLHHPFYGPDFTMEIVTDDGGYRLGAGGPVAPDDAVVALLGDSYTFGWGVDSDETFASYLDDELRRRSARVRVANLGVGGYGTLALAERYRLFLSQRDPRTVRSLVVLHVHNDMTDNVNFALWQGGFREPQLDGSFRPRSWSHAWNWLRSRRRLRRAQARAQEGKPPSRSPEEDLLFHFPMRPTGRTAGPVPLGDGRSVPFESLDLSVEADPSGALAHGALTPLQLDLLVAGIRGIHCAAPDAGTPIHHLVISHAPDWFVAAVGEAVARADACGNRVTFDGRVPVDPARTEAMLNEHSGRHFSPELNRLYAELLLATIEPDLGR